MSKVAVLGDDRGLISRVFHGHELRQVSLPRWGIKNHPVDLLAALCRPRAEWQAEFVRRQIKRSSGKIILTLIDNVEYLGYCSDPNYGIRTIAIQNGLRLPDSEWRYSIDRFRSIRKRNEFQHDIYLAWGEWDAERYLRLGGSARQVISVGSLPDALHRAKPNSALQNHLIGALEIREPGGLFFDVLPFPPRNPQIMSAYANNIRILYSYLERYCKTEAIEPLFVLNSTHELAPQLDLLTDLYPSARKIHHDLPNTLASYDGAASCHVVVGVLSSLLVEVFGRGRKILAFNPSGNEDLNFPIDGIWSLNDGRYEAFAERLRVILEMSPSAWESHVGVASKRLIAYDPHAPTDAVIRKLVSDLMMR